MSANSISPQSVLSSAVFELDEAIKRLKRLESSLTRQSISAGRAGTDAGFAIFVELNRLTDLLDYCLTQCLAINTVSCHSQRFYNYPVSQLASCGRVYRSSYMYTKTRAYAYPNTGGDSSIRLFYVHNT